eukprot:CAMPEP_0117042620 /NCGR_PEP_ID=MMETSP0472-20121206/29669_1 /TAXON_ID=693140 ORGANISM="Tiarina fusus, Strain LIS" /NCGR_SAMPLE_ID=MMETSP0472 /ASSEMBLY_ACC=CAM_ASM_000603 /LENGTH=63 /DNA_ID=CAMNT_0004753909 /DNA_START=199 /DNA_END=387 /DNA_ORIENTATION=-
MPNWFPNSNILTKQRTWSDPDEVVPLTSPINDDHGITRNTNTNTNTMKPPELMNVEFGPDSPA